MKVIKNEEIKPRFHPAPTSEAGRSRDGNDVFLLTLEDQHIAKTAKPGQFVSIRVTNSYEPLLRRPFSIHGVDKNKFKIIYKVVGLGTKILSHYKQGEELDVIGPLGNGFETKNYKNLTLLAGGIGIAPLYFLATQEKEKNLTILIGAKSKSQLLCKTEFSKLGKLLIATEDGSSGKKGLVTDLLTSHFSLPTSHFSVIFACGPFPMLKFVRDYAIKHKIPCQLSLEGHMACGIGVCLGCAVSSKNGYKYVCKDGPVFWANEIEI
ncbi:dihydroorotate dehydrogenase electron transfer subunit [candidate division WOR-3 bacterium]|nr:dihydroorotate dehydrogenase electron transfer subunit [candidate division WOR-3 bacterium]